MLTLRGKSAVRRWLEAFDTGPEAEYLAKLIRDGKIEEAKMFHKREFTQFDGCHDRRVDFLVLQYQIDRLGGDPDSVVWSTDTDVRYR